MSLGVGQTLVITHGVYSNTVIVGVFRVVQEIDVDIAAKEYFFACPSQEGPYKADFDMFTTWLVDHGYLEKIPSIELSLGAYSTICPEVERSYYDT